MPRMTENLVERAEQKNVQEKYEFIKKRFAILSFLDVCIYSFVFCLLLVSPVNALPADASKLDNLSAESASNNMQTTRKHAGINIYVAQLSPELEATCQTPSTRSCQFNVISQKELLAALLAVDSTGEIAQYINNSDYELLIGSAIMTTVATDVVADMPVDTYADISTDIGTDIDAKPENNIGFNIDTKPNNYIGASIDAKPDNRTINKSLLLEISAQWRGITIEDTQFSVVLEKGDSKLGVAQATNTLMQNWVHTALSAKLFEAAYLYQFLGASDYINQLKVPTQIGDFSLSRQHLFNDPMKGMLTRYIHKEFELAVFDVYTYPLKTNLPTDLQIRSELLSEQQDIRLLSQALGEDALTMTNIYEIEAIADDTGFRVFAFEAELQTKSEPLFATLYAYVKNDKLVKFSINVPARITNSLIAQAIITIEVPEASVLMQQARVLNRELLNEAALSITRINVNPSPE